MSWNFLYVAAILLAAASLFSCQKATPLGSELLGDDNTDVLYTDTLPIRATIIREDSLNMYTPDEILISTLMFGDVADPIFGRYRSEMVLQMSLSRNDADVFENAVLDSVVLSMAYDTAVGIYGPTSAMHSVEVYQLDEDLSMETEYFSNRSFNTKMTPIGEKENFIPNLEALVGVVEPSGNDEPDTTIYDPHLRIRLDDSFGDMLIQADTNVYKSDSNFVDFFKGIVLRPGSENSSMVPFNVGNEISRVTVYYTEDDTLSKEYSFRMEDPRPRFSNFNVYDYQGTDVEPFISDPDMADSLLFVHSNAGLDVRLEFPDLEELQGVIVNHAELELVLAELPEDEPDNFSPVQRIILTTEGEDGSLDWIPDVTFAFNRGDLNIFGGAPFTQDIDGSLKESVKMNLSDYFQRIVDGTEDPQLILTTFFDRTRVSRSIFYGPGHSTYPVRLKVTYSLPQ